MTVLVTFRVSNGIAPPNAEFVIPAGEAFAIFPNWGRCRDAASEALNCEPMGDEVALYTAGLGRVACGDYEVCIQRSNAAGPGDVSALEEGILQVLPGYGLEGPLRVVGAARTQVMRSMAGLTRVRGVVAEACETLGDELGRLDGSDGAVNPIADQAMLPVGLGITAIQLGRAIEMLDRMITVGDARSAANSQRVEPTLPPRRRIDV